MVLYEDRYIHHIANRRDYIEVQAIERVIESPEVITTDEQDDLRECYYAREVMSDYPAFFLKVVVSFAGADGKVITAFDTDRPKPTERVVWQQEH